jgi:hypothetical protein
MASPIKVRITPDNLAESQQPIIRPLPHYPDTGETGETYDLEFEQVQLNKSDDEAIQKAREFLRQHRPER